MTLRKRNYSVYEISQALKEQGTPLSATAVREVLAAEGYLIGTYEQCHSPYLVSTSN